MELHPPYVKIEPPPDIVNGLSRHKRIELWRQFTAHLIGLATVIWWMVYREAPPK